MTAHAFRIESQHSLCGLARNDETLAVPHERDRKCMLCRMHANIKNER